MPDTVPKKTCFVTGATGAVGPAVVGELCRSGYQVSVLSRSPIAPGMLPNCERIFRGDITDYDAVKASMDGANLVVHLASLLHVNNPRPSLRREFERVNVEGTSNVVRAAKAVGVERLILVSSIAVYGYHHGRMLSEASIAQPDSIYGRTKLEAESIALAESTTDNTPLATVLRLAAVYGSRVKGNYRSLLRALARHRFIPIGDGSNRRTLVHCGDVARAICHVAHRREAAGEVYNVTDGGHHSLREIIEAMCTALGRKPPVFSVPTRFAKAAVLPFEAAAYAVGRKPTLGLMLEKYLEEVVVSGDKIQKATGFAPLITLHKGWQKTVQEMRESGEL